MVVGCGIAFVVALPLFFMIGMLFHVDSSWIGAWLFWKVPILFGLVSSVVGFISPTFAADWLGNAWKGVIYVWRSFYGG